MSQAAPPVANAKDDDGFRRVLIQDADGVVADLLTACDAPMSAFRREAIYTIEQLRRTVGSLKRTFLDSGIPQTHEIVWNHLNAISIAMQSATLGLTADQYPPLSPERSAVLGIYEWLARIVIRTQEKGEL